METTIATRTYYVWRRRADGRISATPYDPRRNPLAPRNSFEILLATTVWEEARSLVERLAPDTYIPNNF